MIPHEDRLSIRVIAPLEARVENVAKEFGVTREEAKRRVTNREEKRAAFIRQSFNAEVADPGNYDLVISTQNLSLDAALGAVIGLVVGGKEMVIKKPTPAKRSK